MRQLAVLLGLVAIALGGCGPGGTGSPSGDPAGNATVAPIPSASRTPIPLRTLAPTPTPVPWSLGDAHVRHPSVAQIGALFTIRVTITNAGSEPNPLTIVSLNGLGAAAEIAGCKPDCSISGMEASFGGIRPGESVVLKITLVAAALGRADYNVCVYATERSSSQVGCVSAAIVVTR